MTSILYGIPNCDTVRKAKAWLGERGVAHAFHDWRRDGVDAALLGEWIDRLGWEALLNRRGTTFRGLPDGDRVDLDAAKALAIMAASPATIRRPILVAGDRLIVGFDPDAYATLA